MYIYSWWMMIEYANRNPPKWNIWNHSPGEIVRRLCPSSQQIHRISMDLVLCEGQQIFEQGATISQSILQKCVYFDGSWGRPERFIQATSNNSFCTFSGIPTISLVGPIKIRLVQYQPFLFHFKTRGLTHVVPATVFMHPKSKIILSPNSVKDQ